MVKYQSVKLKIKYSHQNEVEETTQKYNHEF